jgi:hypothetical protein
MNADAQERKSRNMTDGPNTSNTTEVNVPAGNELALPL